MKKLWLVGAVVAGTLLVLTPQVPQAQARAYEEKTTSVLYEGYVTAFTNGKTAYYIRESEKDGTAILCKYRIGAEGPTQIKELKWFDGPAENEPYAWSVANVRKGWVYLNCGDGSQGFKGIYRVRTTGGKLTKLKVRANIRLAYGSNKYVAVGKRAHSDVSAEDYTLYRIVKGKLKKLRRIATYGFSLTAVGKKLYFTRSKDYSLGVTSLYRCSFTGKNIKKLGGPWKGAANSWGGHGQVIVEDITRKKCTVTIDKAESGNVHYRYTYKTRKLAKE